MESLLVLLLAFATQVLPAATYRGWNDIVLDVPDSWHIREGNQSLLVYPQGREKTTGVYMVTRLPGISDVNAPRIDEFFQSVLRRMEVKKTEEPDTLLTEGPGSRFTRWTLDGKFGRTTGYFGAAVVKGDEAVVLMALDTSNALQANFVELRTLLLSARREAPALSPTPAPPVTPQPAKQEYEVSFRTVQTRTPDGRVAEADKMIGTLVNRSERTFQLARIHVELRNKEGKAIRQYTREVKNLKPGKDQDFEVYNNSLLFRQPKLFYKVEIE